MDDAPDVWSDEATEEPLEPAHKENVVVESLVVDAGADHGADSAGHGDEVEDGADESVVVFERNNRVLEAAGASFVSHKLYNYAKTINLIF